MATVGSNSVKKIYSLEGVSLYGLTDKQKRFVLEYVTDWNASRAAEAAGYKVSRNMGQRLVNGKASPKVAKVISQIVRNNEEKSSLSREGIIKFLANVIQCDPANLFDGEGELITSDMNKVPPEIRVLFDDVKIVEKTDNGGKLEKEFHCTLMKKSKAVELLMKHLGMFAPEEVKHDHQFSIAAMVEEARNAPDNLDVIEGAIRKA